MNKKKSEGIIERVVIEELAELIRAIKKFVKDPYAIDVVMLLSMGIMFGAYNLYQVITRLGLSRSKSYERIGYVSLYRWKNILEEIGYETAIPLLKEKISRSASTRSRAGIVMVVDDTVLARFAECLSYVWKWWSGQLKKVAFGQKIIGLVLVIDGLVIPLELEIVSKQGKGLENPSEHLASLWRRACEKFKKEGIDIYDIPVAFDSAFLDDNLPCLLENEDGIRPTIVSQGKSNFVLEAEGKSQKIGEWYKEVELKDTWGCEELVYRVCGYNPTLGKIVVIFFKSINHKRITCLILPTTPLRSCEAINIYHYRSAIERLWKSFKYYWKIKSKQQHNTNGAYACLGSTAMGYITLLRIFYKLKKYRRFSKLTIPKLITICQDFLDIPSIIKEHFHIKISLNPNIDAYMSRF
jgi:hypothetical protein